MTTGVLATGPGKWVRWFCVGLSGLSAAAWAQGEGDGREETVAPAVEVTAPPVRILTPLPGVVLDEERTSVNVQSATAQEIVQARSVSVTEFLNTQMQSITVNDYSGNPFQQDVSYRGFSASPLIGTPQGLSVYVDGVRVNEPFGDVVNWDLLPINAIERMDLIPGSNPLFGLNTLGGAIAVSTKSGFWSPGVDATLLGGSWGRRQAQLTVGGSTGDVAGLLAYNRLYEDGWRDNSPSDINQLFGRADLRTGWGQITLSGLYADNALTGNGVVPIEMSRGDRERVFTSPDEVTNQLAQIALNGRVDLSDATAISLLGYYRRLRQSSDSGDIYDEWDQAANGRTGPCPDVSRSTFPDGAVEIDAPGCSGVTPNGVFNRGTSDQDAWGLAGQLNWISSKNQLILGATFDTNEVEFQQGQQLAWVGANRDIYLDPTSSVGNDLVALRQEIKRNDLTGSSTTYSLFFYDVWSPRANLNVSLGGRYNYTRVKNQVMSDRPIPLYQFTTQNMRFWRPICGAQNGDPLARYYCSSGDYTYESFNPSIGVSWLPTPRVNVFANVSRGARTPSAIELGCARDRVAEKLSRGKLQGCSIPTALTNDPFLPQVRSTSYELGARGAVFTGVLWNAAVFRTDLEDDILFVSLGRKNRGVFDTFGNTRREGLELGLTGSIGRHTWNVFYTRLNATFQDEARVANLSNSTSSKQQGQVNEFVIQPGDEIPGIPRDSLRLGWNMQVTPRFNVGLNVIAQSWSYVRGNENNDHAPGGTDSDGSRVRARYDPTITTKPGRAYVGEGTIDGFAVLNLNASYRLNEKLTVFLKMDNVFDESYATAGELGLNPFTPTRWGMRDAAGFNYNSFDWTHSQFIGPGSPRAIWIGLAYSSRGTGF